VPGRAASTEIKTSHAASKARSQAGAATVRQWPVERVRGSASLVEPLGEPTPNAAQAHDIDAEVRQAVGDVVRERVLCGPMTPMRS
jgi:hypothetical protein